MLDVLMPSTIESSCRQQQYAGSVVERETVCGTLIAVDVDVDMDVNVDVNVDVE